jgi:hypothetical protein
MSRLALERRNDIWTYVVKFYTKCKLTMPEDKLIAISGPVRKLLIVYGYCQSYGGGRSILGLQIRRFTFNPSIIEHHRGVGKV